MTGLPTANVFRGHHDANDPKRPQNAVEHDREMVARMQSVSFRKRLQEQYLVGVSGFGQPAFDQMYPVKQRFSARRQRDRLTLGGLGQPFDRQARWA